MRNCFLVHNNWFLDQLETSQQLEYVWHALFGGGHGTTVRSADVIWSLWGGQTQLFEKFFKLREEKKKSRTCISPPLVTINLIINKTLKTRWPWEKSERLGMCRGPVGPPHESHLKVRRLWGLYRWLWRAALKSQRPLFCDRWSLVQTQKVLQLEARSWPHRCMLRLKTTLPLAWSWVAAFSRALQCWKQAWRKW